MNNLFDIADSNSKITAINDSFSTYTGILVSKIKETVEKEAKDFIKKYPFTHSIKFSVGTYYDDQDYSDVEVRSVYAHIIYDNREIPISAEESESCWEDILIYRPVTQEQDAYNEKVSEWMSENRELVEKFNSDLYSFYMLLKSINIILLEKAYEQSTIEITANGIEEYAYEY